MDEYDFLPRTNRLSVVTALILLAYALMPFVNVPGREVSFRLLGILIEFRLNFTLLVSLLTAGLAAAGTDWLIRDHPHLARQPIFPHYLLPALTAWAIGIPLGSIEVSPQWWVVFGLGSLLMLLVLVSEYINVDVHNIRYALSLMVLSAVSFGLLLTLSIALRASNLRLYMLLIALVPSFALLCLRLFQLRLQGKWNFEWSGAITLIIAQLAIGLYYWPLSPIRFGLILLGAAYALIEIGTIFNEGASLREKFIEPVMMLGVFWTLAIFIG